MLAVCSQMPSCCLCVHRCPHVLCVCSHVPSCCLCHHRCLHGCVFISVVFSQLPSWCFCVHSCLEVVCGLTSRLSCLRLSETNTRLHQRISLHITFLQLVYTALTQQVLMCHNYPYENTSQMKASRFVKQLSEENCWSREIRQRALTEGGGRSG